jgi:D-sedoheptulose 7-phosphate isomerase
MPRADHSTAYLAAAADLASAIDPGQLDTMVDGLARVRAQGGRLFVLGVGGGAGHASHAVNDFRKICHLESYAPTDNVSELTARTNDDGWDTTLSRWLEISRLSALDALLVFSVSGGSRERRLSVNLVGAMDAARRVGARIYGVTGVPGGVLGELADVAILLDPPPALYTPLVESLQAAVWHALVSHPDLAAEPARWESLAAGSRGVPQR